MVILRPLRWSHYLMLLLDGLQLLILDNLVLLAVVLLISYEESNAKLAA